MNAGKLSSGVTKPSSATGKPPRKSYGEMSNTVKLVKHLPSKMVSGKRKLASVQQNYKKTPQSHPPSSANTTISTDTSLTMNSNSMSQRKDPAMNLMESFKTAHKSILKKPDHASSSMTMEDYSSDATDATTRLNTLKNKTAKNAKRPLNSSFLDDSESTQPRKKRVVVFDDSLNNDEECQEIAVIDSTARTENEISKAEDGNNNNTMMELLNKVLENQKLILERQDKILERVESLEKKALEDHQEK